MRDLLEGNEKGMDLHEFLIKFGGKLRHVRAMYIVEPNLEKGKVIKFGIAGTNTGNAYARLKEYEILYGEAVIGTTEASVIIIFINRL
tara:strand:+ start:207 stop:470 length:264 start_codon:yes stop_codon:yes gene_type:complete